MPNRNTPERPALTGKDILSVGHLQRLVTELARRALAKRDIAAVYRLLAADGELGVSGHFLSLIPGHAVAQELRQRLHFLGQERGHALGGSVVWNSHEHDKLAGTFHQQGPDQSPVKSLFHQGSDLRFATFPDDQVSLL